jgi:hypothetical protein
MKICPVCGVLLKKSQYKYCSNLCQSKDRYHKYIEGWKIGSESGSRGINTKCISRHIKHFLIDKYGEKCSLCGWDEINHTTGNVPLEIDHINGNAEDNREENIRIICPNCHSLSHNYRNLNKGRGRIWRKNKYLKQVSGPQIT